MVSIRSSIPLPQNRNFYVCINAVLGTRSHAKWLSVIMLLLPTLEKIHLLELFELSLPPHRPHHNHQCTDTAGDRGVALPVLLN